MIASERTAARKSAWVAGSIGLHAALLAAAMAWPRPPVPEPPPRVVEVQLAPPVRGASGPPAASPRRPAKARAPGRVPRRHRLVQPDPRREAVRPRTAPAPELALATAEPSSEVDFGGAAPAAAAPFPGLGAGGGGGGGDGEGTGSAWLEDRFREILRRIQHRIDRAPYPPLARARGWTGLVRVSFLLRPDGSIADVRVHESSGYPPLDRCAVEAVRRAVPFPRPPRAEVVVVPIRFELEAAG